MIHPPRGSFEPATVVVPPLHPDDSSGAARALIWALATSIIAGLHVALYLAVAGSDAEPPLRTESLAAIMVNLAPAPVTAKSEVDNASEGPPAQASEAEAAPPEPPPAETVMAPDPLPDVTPPAVLPATPKPRTTREPEKPAKEHKPHPKPEPLRKPKTPDKATSRAGGGPRSDRQTADRTAAPSPGDMISDATRATWQSEVRSRIVRAKRFPSEAHGTTGVAVLSVTFKANGGVTGVHLVTSSGNAALDDEAVAVMSRAAPYPPPPGGHATTLRIPLNFRR